MPQTTQPFVEVLRRSRLLTAAQEAEFAARLDRSPGDGGDDQLLAQQLINDRWITPFQAERLLAGRFRELHIGPYVLTHLIGVGGMGSVYAALDPATQQTVAVKVLSSDFKYDAGMRTRFRLEARVGASVDHPNLLRTLAHGTTDDVFGEMDYVVMELFRGIGLHELLSVHGPMSWSMACDIASQAAAALQYLHDRGLVHRDVKPDNLLVDESGRVKLIDYGLALSGDAVRNGIVHEGNEEFTLTMLFGHDCLGTPDYMPPEQAANSLAADARSDIYALGCTLFTLLAAARPYRAANKALLLEAHRSEPVPHVRTVVPGVPRELDAIVARMMAKSPDERIRSMDSVVLGLAPYATRRPVRFSYDELLVARRRLAEKKSSIARRGSGARSTSGLRAAILAQHLETVVAAETDVSGVTSGGSPRATPKTAPAVPVQTAAESAEQAVAAYRAVPDSSTPVLASLIYQNGMEVPIRGMHFTVGRAHDNDLSLPVGDLSARHCSLTFDGQHWVLRDADSRNGVRVNGRRIKEASLRPGDLLTLGGSTHFHFALPGQPRLSLFRIAIALTAFATAVAAAWWGWSLWN